MIPAWSDGILACLDPGAGFFLIILSSATLSYTLGLVWNDQMSWADQNEKCCQRGSNESQSYTVRGCCLEFLPGKKIKELSY